MPWARGFTAPRYRQATDHCGGRSRLPSIPPARSNPASRASRSCRSEQPVGQRRAGRTAPVTVTVKRLLIDIETRSMADLKKAGIHNYARDPTTSVTHVGFTFDGSPIEMWQPRLGKMPGQLRELISNPATEL